MPKKRQTLRSLVLGTSLDLEETLLHLWEEGLGYLTSFDTPIKKQDLKTVYSLLGIPKEKELSKKNYWKKSLNLDDKGLQRLLSDLGFSWNPKKSRIPKEFIADLQREKDKTLTKKKAQEAEGLPKKDKQITPPKVEWKEIGHAPTGGKIRFLTFKEVVSFHEALAKDFERHHDPIVPVGVRSDSLLKSAVFRPHTSIGSSAKYPTIEMASAALIHSIIHNHPFHNGNKRTALVSMLVMLDENGLIFEEQEDALFRQVIRIAKHSITNPHPKDRDDREVLEISRWIQSCSRSIQKGERPTPYRKLRSRLISLKCTFGERHGNKIVVSRKVKGYGMLRRNKILNFTLHCRSDGDEIDQNTISRLRRELELDEKHGVDSTTFYDTGEVVIDGFIRTYRKTLQKLSKM